MKNKKNLTSLIVLSVMFAGMTSLTACDDDIIYQANTRFLYSVNAGTNWSETIQEVEIDSTYYIAIEMQVVQSKETDEEKIVKADVIIPNTNVLDCYLDDHPGVSITGIPDPVNNIITYPFDIVAGVSPAKFRVVFKCTPLSIGKASISVVYDDNVSQSWDVTGTIQYVSSNSNENDSNLDNSSSNNSSSNNSSSNNSNSSNSNGNDLNE